MSRHATPFLKAALSALYYSGAGGIAAPFTRGDGVIFMLHRVTPEPVRPFEPNRILKVTPEFLDAVLSQVIEAGYDLLSLDDVPDRIAAGKAERPFACFTLDDGYRDNSEHAFPVFKRYAAPFTVYVPADYMDGRGDLWWLMLERVIDQSITFTVEMDGAERTFLTDTVSAKDHAYREIYWWLRTISEFEARAVVARLAAGFGLDGDALCAEMMMNWDEVRALAADPLVTIGAHTCRHMSLAKLDADTARHEISASVARVEQELGRPCRHFSYPYGCRNSAGIREFEMVRELGLHTAVTTRKGQIDSHVHEDRLTELPRLSLNGDYQDPRYVKVMMSGMPFRLWNALGRMTGTVEAR